MSEKEKKKQASDNEGNIEVNTEGTLQENSASDKSSDTDSELEKLKAELEETKDKYIRKIAEFDNYRRRTAQEAVELRKTAGKEVITDMLDVLDDCDRAQKQMDNSEDVQEIKEGVQLVFNKFRI